VRSARPIDLGIDGEAVTLESPVRLEVQPGALRVRIAPHHPGISPARLAGAVQQSAWSRLVYAAFGPNRERGSAPPPG
jgi:hypothetical protein